MRVKANKFTRFFVVVDLKKVFSSTVQEIFLSKQSVIEKQLPR